MNTTLTYYQTHAAEFAQSTLDVDVSALYAEFEPLLPQNAKVLDAGCGAGRDLKYFTSKGHNAIGIDASSNLVDIAKQQSGCNVLCKTFEQISWQNEFDGIWCCASLLHVPTNQLTDVFKRLETALKPQGVLYVSFKYGSEEKERNGRWFRDLNEQLLTEYLLSVPKLKIKKHWITGDARPGRADEKWLNAILLKE
ncbi:class I SAM-dependent methyltransferase [Thalassotalea sp. LPB0316]|uniref:class I SAM-dependent methyltransferase n=1 Tax=Thalassotalea sp. LPB0316 TaxID=2769490 RepID=UPI001869132B|nr:class I SAM-dependent methyltransferase [Thalassotalea sp. LPB0316]QOL26238.1 class I SAM-dependent methyltransferase [Thalassotalea sp. LPB0316]